MLTKLIMLGLAGFGLWVLLRRAFAAPPAPPPERRTRIEAQDLVPCPRCGAYKAPQEDCASCLDRPARKFPEQR